MRWSPALLLAAFAVAGDAPIEVPTERCLYREDNVIRSLPYRDCVELLAPERIRGTWFVGLEESGFLPEGAPLPAVRVIGRGPTPPEMDTHLDVGWRETLELLESVPQPEGEGTTARYAVEFIGRRARFAGCYGHGDLAHRLIVVDRFLSIRPAGRVMTRIEFPSLHCNLPDCPDSYTPDITAPPGVYADAEQRERRRRLSGKVDSRFCGNNGQVIEPMR